MLVCSDIKERWEMKQRAAGNDRSLVTYLSSLQKLTKQKQIVNFT